MSMPWIWENIIVQHCQLCNSVTTLNDDFLFAPGAKPHKRSEERRVKKFASQRKLNQKKNRTRSLHSANVHSIVANMSLLMMETLLRLEMLLLVMLVDFTLYAVLSAVYIPMVKWCLVVVGLLRHHSTHHLRLHSHTTSAIVRVMRLRLAMLLVLLGLGLML